MDDMWRFDIENVQWNEQKPDLVGMVAEKIVATNPSDGPGKTSKHTLLSINQPIEDNSQPSSLILVSEKLAAFSFNLQSKTWSKLKDEEENLTLQSCFNLDNDFICVKANEQS